MLHVLRYEIYDMTVVHAQGDIYSSFSIFSFLVKHDSILGTGCDSTSGAI